MKKLTMLICLLAASLTLAACSSSSQSKKSEEGTTQQKLEEGAEQAEEDAEEAKSAAAEDADEAAEVAEEADEKNTKAMSEICPATIEGVQAEAKKGEGKMSLAMMASGENVAEVQKRAQMMAKHHNSMHGHAGKSAKKGKGKGMKGRGKRMKGAKGTKGHGVMGMSTAEYEKTDKGAMVHFTPAEAEHMAGLEKQVGEHAKWINEGKCPGRQMAKGKKKMKGKKEMKGEKGEDDAPDAE